MHFRLLGPVDVVSGDTPWSITARRERAVLLRLLLEPGRPVSAERIIDDVWEDQPPADARGALRVLVARLRRGIPDGDEPRIVRASDGYELRLTVDDEIDGAQFEAAVVRARDVTASDPAVAAARLREALDLWRGPALGDLADLAFARPEAVRLEELRVAAIEARVEADLRCGLHREIVGELEALCATYPLRENLWGHRMIALQRSGRQTEALRAFQELRTVLADEVGLEPSPALRQLESAIVVGELPGPAVPAAFSPPPERDSTTPGRVGFVGRERELQQMLERFASTAGQGQRALVLLRGEPGAGKSSLAEEFATQAEARGAIIVRGRFDPEMLLPYQGFVEVLRAIGAQPVAGAGAAMASEHLDEVLGRVAEGGWTPPDGHGTAELARHQLFAAVEDVLAAAAQEQPLVVVLDDLQWTDPSSLLLLKQIVRGGVPIGLFLVATYQHTSLDEEHPAKHAIADLHREPNVDDVEVGPLSASEIVELVRQRPELADVADELADTVVQRTDGHAFFASALVSAMSDPGQDPVSRTAIDVPTTLQEFISASVSRLSRPARTMLTAGAACGVTFSPRFVRLASDLDEQAPIAAIEECVRTGLLEELDDGTVVFAHGLVRDVLYGKLATVRRLQLHQSLADAGEHVLGTQVGHADIARHLRLAHPDPANLLRRVGHARAAGDEAMRSYAYDVAAEWYLDAVAASEQLDDPMPEDGALAVLAARALAVSGQPHRAVDLARTAVARARSAADPILQARAALALEEATWTGHGFVAPASATEVAQTLREAFGALDTVSDGDVPALRAELATRLPRVLHHGTDPRERIAFADEAIRLADGSGSPRLRGAALESMRWALWGTHDAGRVARVSDDVLETARAAGDAPLEVRGLVWRYLSRLDLGDLAGARAALDELRQLGEVVPDPLALWYPAMAECTLALLAGRYDDAEAHAFGAAEIARRLDLVWAVENFGIQLHQIRREQDRLGELEDATIAAARRQGDAPAWRLALADLHLQLGRPTEARAMLRDVVSGIDALPQDLAWLASVTLAAELAIELRDETSAAAIHPVLDPAADRIVVIGPGVVCTGSASRLVGGLAMVLERPDEASVGVEAALLTDRQLGATPWVARDHLLAAQLRARSGDREAARADLLRARSLAEGIGAKQILRACEQANLT